MAAPPLHPNYSRRSSSFDASDTAFAFDARVGLGGFTAGGDDPQVIPTTETLDDYYLKCKFNLDLL